MTKHWTVRANGQETGVFVDDHELALILAEEYEEYSQEVEVVEELMMDNSTVNSKQDEEEDAEYAAAMRKWELSTEGTGHSTTVCCCC